MFGSHALLYVCFFWEGLVFGGHIQRGWRLRRTLAGALQLCRPPAQVQTAVLHAELAAHHACVVQGVSRNLADIRRVSRVVRLTR